MAARQLRYDYVRMQKLSKGFRNQSGQIMSSYRNLKEYAESLHGAGWVGLAADKWFKDMENILLPKTKELGKILDELGTLIPVLSELYQTAEDAAAALFKKNP